MNVQSEDNGWGRNGLEIKPLRIKSGLTMQFLQAFIQFPQKALDMYKYIEMKFKKFKNYDKYYCSQGKHVLNADFVIHLANQYVESPMVDSIVSFLKDRISVCRKEGNNYNKQLRGNSWLEISELEKWLQYEIETPEGENPDEGERQYWEFISECGEAIDLTNFMFRLLIKEVCDGTFKLSLVNLTKKDYREFVQKYCKNKLNNLDF
jgi:hypothetical protein